MKKSNCSGVSDHIDDVYAQWQRDMPEIGTNGARILARARRLTLLVRPEIEAVFKSFELDTGEFDVLATLRRSGAPYALRPTELYRALMISSGGLTDRLDRLKARGLIRRRPSEEDKRSELVELTALGRKKIEAAFVADMAVENRLTAHLSPGEHEELCRLLRKLLLQLEQEGR
ncbi:MAG: MarR family transcriptional regulator [Micropepsaceae bacterium]